MSKPRQQSKKCKRIKQSTERDSVLNNKKSTSERSEKPCKMLDNLAPNKTSENKTLISINFYIVGLGGLFMFFVGMITNTLNLILLTRKSMKSTTNKYLTALAICDMLVLIFSTLITSNSFINDYDMATIDSNGMSTVGDLLHVSTGRSQLIFFRGKIWNQVVGSNNSKSPVDFSAVKTCVIKLYFDLIF